MTTIVETAADALAGISSGQHIWVHSMAATPVLLLQALAERAKSLQDVTLLQLHLENAEVLTDPELDGHLRNRCYFAGKGMREMIHQGRADYAPIFLSEIPKIFRNRRQPVDVALIQVSPPDRHGNCSLGVSVEATRAACEMADTVIAQINPSMPRTHGDSLMPLQDIDIAFEQNHPLPVAKPRPLNEVHRKIGAHVAALIDDGACLQMGIGAIPDAALAHLGGHRHLGIHTEMFSDGIIPLVENGAIDNSLKSCHPGKIVTGFVLGSQNLYDFIDDNSQVALLDIEYVNNPNVIRKNNRVVSINSAIQVDLTGQVCADSIGSEIFSGVGGQLDFVMGSRMSKGGRSIIAMPATAMSGKVSRIAATLAPGAGVVTTRAHVDHIVTEFGVASLMGCSLQERAKALIAIAHPDYREVLTRDARDQLGLKI
jgi:acyl-CoA hydrolase